MPMLPLMDGFIIVTAVLVAATIGFLVGRWGTVTG
jgi:hypothetical protein